MGHLKHVLQFHKDLAAHATKTGAKIPYPATPKPKLGTAKPPNAGIAPGSNVGGQPGRAAKG